jgi:hypothetical protein
MRRSTRSTTTGKQCGDNLIPTDFPLCPTPWGSFFIPIKNPPAVYVVERYFDGREMIYIITTAIHNTANTMILVSVDVKTSTRSAILIIKNDCNFAVREIVRFSFQSLNPLPMTGEERSAE